MDPIQAEKILSLGVPTDSTHRAYILLRCLSGSVNQGELSEKLGLSDASISRHVSALVNMDLAVRDDDDEDRRRKVIVATRRGQSMIRHWLKRV